MANPNNYTQNSGFQSAISWRARENYVMSRKLTTRVFLCAYKGRGKKDKSARVSIFEGLTGTVWGRFAQGNELFREV